MCSLVHCLIIWLSTPPRAVTFDYDCTSLGIVGGAMSKEDRPGPTQAPSSKFRSKPLSAPKPPGLISSASSSAASSSGVPLVTPKAKAKRDPNWKQRRRGKRDLLRAIQHAASKQNENFSKVGEDPDPEAPRMTRFPSDYFFWKAEPNLLARYASFLLQSLLIGQVIHGHPMSLFMF